MLGRTLPSGSDAISFHNTLFRVSELCWIKAVRLSPAELAVRVASLLLAIAWVFVIKSAKGTYYNIEFLLGLFPLVLAWSTSGSLRIGCSGDFEESYEERRGVRGDLFRGWIETLRAKEPDWVHLRGAAYDVLLNPERIAWIRPCYQWQLFPLIVIAAFAGYLTMLGVTLPAEMPVIDDFQILIFEGGTGNVRLFSYLIIAVAAVAFGLSIKRSMEICGTGGVQDTFPMSAVDQSRLVDLIVGQTAPKSTAAKVAKSPKGQSMEAIVAAPMAKAPARVEGNQPVTSKELSNETQEPKAEA
jgi:hypothetical protein